MMWLVLDLAVRSWVSRVNNRMQPRGEPVLAEMDFDVWLPAMTVCCLCVRKPRTQLEVPVSTSGNLSFSTSCCGFKCRAEVDEEE